MELIQKSEHVLTMKYPASWHDALWREGLVSGNGEVGINIYGGTKRETMLINHSALWHGEPQPELPDVSDSLQKTREAMDEERFLDASWILSNALRERGYQVNLDSPLPLAALCMTFLPLSGFSKYLRAVNMETGEISSQYQESGKWIRKDAFVSRKDDIIFYRLKADAPVIHVDFMLDSYNDAEDGGEMLQFIKQHKKPEAEKNVLRYSCENVDGKAYGAVAVITCADGELTTNETSISVRNASEILVKLKVFVNGQSSVSALEGELLSETGDYAYYLKRHVKLHSPLYHSASLSLGQNRNLSNEELLLEAYSDDASNELLEKLWRFGRYLFISGTREGALPIPLYGIWCGEYYPTWSHYMANINIQMSYWHTSVGNLEALNKPFFEFYNEKIPVFQDSARKLYGCRGIYITAGTTPNVSIPNQVVPVIMNWVSTGGWLAQHYYNYYLYTKDKEYLKSTLLPFMEQVADFYEDFITFYEDGTIKFYPSVSPENTPQNFMPPEGVEMPHPMPTTINSTSDMAIVKEFFTNMLAIAGETKLYQDKTAYWEKIVTSIPEYAVNEDGAVREWQDKRFDDRYFHRHLSHLYPVFPGNEISTQDSRIKAFERAVELRDVGAQTGWSMALMASIYARFERGNDSLHCLDNMVKACLHQNFLSVHNDWRRMDISLEMESHAPIQLDASLGCVNALQEMILYSSPHLVKLLPAIADRMTVGAIENWRFCDGSICMEWDIPGQHFHAVLQADRAASLVVQLPRGFSQLDNTAEGDCDVIREGDNLKVRFAAGGSLRIDTV